MKLKSPFFKTVIPAQAGTQLSYSKPQFKLGPRLRGGDGLLGNYNSKAKVLPC
jgi:hypothetical protein